MENLRTAELFMQFCSARLIIISDKATETHLSAAEALNMSVITADDLKFSRGETAECFAYCGTGAVCGTKFRDANWIYTLTEGQAMRTKLCIKLVSVVAMPKSSDNIVLLAQYAAAAMSKEEIGAILCSAAFDRISEDYLRSLGESELLTRSFGSDTFYSENFFRIIKSLGKKLGLCGADMKKRWRSFRVP